MKKDIELIVQKNEKYFANDFKGIESEKNFSFTEGKIPIIISAPHAVRQLRDGKEKIADSLTGPLTEILSEEEECHSIIRTYNSNDDPNFDKEGIGAEYKEKLAEYIREKNIEFLLDLHGYIGGPKDDFQIGTNYGKSLNGKKELLDILRINLSLIGSVSIDDTYPASREGIISKYISSVTGIPCIQLEVGKKYRSDIRYINQLLQVLSKSIKEINSVLHKKDNQIEL